MNYKTRLQANNTEVQNNNVDLQAILNTINSLPTATNLDTEITEQEEISISQDTLIDQIQAALEGKAGNNLDTSDATATADDILKDKTAYVNGEKITGTHECSGEKTTKTVYLDWTEDYEYTGIVTYISNNQIMYATNGNDVIEAEYGILFFNSSYQYDTGSFVNIHNNSQSINFYIVQKDGATLRIITSTEQEV